MRKAIVYFIYCVVILCLAGCALNKPAYNWDILPYMAIILSYDKADDTAIHSKVYNIAKEQIPPVFYNRLVEPSIVYRNNMAKKPDAFQTQLPFYIVKPFYTRMAWIFYRGGITLPLATVWPSVIAYLFTGLLLVFWLGKYSTTIYACLASTCIMLSSPVLTAAGLSTPDAISGLLLFTATYFLTERKSLTGTMIFFCFAILARLDNILPAICVMSVVLFTNRFGSKFFAAKTVFIFGILLLVYFIVSAAVHSFGWSMLYYPGFVKQLNTSYTLNSTFIFKEYLELVRVQLSTGFYYSFLSLFFFLVLLVSWGGAISKFSAVAIEQVLAMVFALVIVLRFILQPLIADRLYIPYYLSVMAFLVKKYSLAYTGSNYNER